MIGRSPAGRFRATDGPPAARPCVNQRREPIVSRSAIVLITSLVVAGCYGSPPRRPPAVPLPPLAPGAAIVVSSEARVALEEVTREARTCSDQGAGPCAVTRYTETVPVTHVDTRATYRGQPLTYPQLRRMTDPGYDAKLADLARLSHRCRRANVPRYAGLGLWLVGLGSLAVTSGTTRTVLFFGGVGGGIGSYTLGYLSYGGRDCVRARRLADDLDMTGKLDWVVMDGERHAAEMKELADRFNAARGARVEAPPPTAPPPAAVPPPAAAPPAPTRPAKPVKPARPVVRLPRRWQ